MNILGWSFFTLCFFLFTSTQVFSQGFGCEENLPDEDRIDCHPESGSNEASCRAKNCTWCEAENDIPGVTPWCFFPGEIDPDRTTTPMPGFGCDEFPLPPEDRIDCFPEGGANEINCRRKNCTWCPAEPDGTTPWCYFAQKPSMGGYLMVGDPVETPNGYSVRLQRAEPEEPDQYWDGEEEFLSLHAEFQSDYRLRIFINGDAPGRWQVPLEIRPAQGGNSNRLYSIEFSNDPLFSFRVIRVSSGAVLFDTGIEGSKFIFAEQYLTLAWGVPTENVYGIGENEQHSFKHSFGEGLTNWPLYARDQPPDNNANMYGVQPYYTVLEADGSAHSVALINSNAQEFSFNTGPSIKYTTIGGVFDFYFFLGPTPENTVEQYTEAVGRAQIPPYWALGFQLCRYGYNSIENMKAAVDRTAQYQIPQDVQYGDIDIMRKALDFTYDDERFAGLPEYIQELKSRGIKFMTILDPCISIGEPPGTYRPYDLGNEMDVWYKRSDGSNAIGKVWPEDPIYFPDYSKNSTREWWIILIKEFHDLLEYDGLWIDMNEPANFVYGDVEGCDANKWNNPPYVPKIRGGSLPDKSVCADHQDSVSSHYNTHSLYGWFQSEPTLTGTRAGTGKRSLVLSRSTFLGSGHWVAHWLGDNFSRWSNLHYSIIGMLQFNQFGIPFVGSDIGGFIDNSNAQLVQRWMQLGSFYTFARNHNGINYIDQDPGAFGPEVAESSRKVLLIRYTLLPYLYTLFYHHQTKGSTVVRALWHQFPNDPNTYEIDRQFLWGKGLLISPVLEEDSTSVDLYYPNWPVYDYHDGSQIRTRGQRETVDAPMDYIPLHILGGNIIPTQEPAINTEISRGNPFGLIVALDDQGTATGDLYYDDGDSIDTIQSGDYFLGSFVAGGNGIIQGTVEHNGWAGMSEKVLNTIRVLGVNGQVNEVQVNGNPHTDFENLASGEVLIRNLGLKFDSTWTIFYYT